MNKIIAINQRLLMMIQLHAIQQRALSADVVIDLVANLVKLIKAQFLPVKKPGNHIILLVKGLLQLLAAKNVLIPELHGSASFVGIAIDGQELSALCAFVSDEGVLEAVIVLNGLARRAIEVKITIIAARVHSNSPC
jgi:hypothetical protein